jgi:hypothetical protein
LIDDRSRDGQPTEAAVEDSDRSVSHSGTLPIRVGVDRRRGR